MSATTSPADEEEAPVVRIVLDVHGRLIELHRPPGVEVTLTRPDGERTDLGSATERSSFWERPTWSGDPIGFRP